MKEGGKRRACRCVQGHRRQGRHHPV